jgi:predicted alpha/beta hydrolase
MKENLSIRAADGYFLSVTSFSPKRSNRKVILINSATGVKQEYYFEFAQYLAAEGFKVYTYDYRGIGGSRPEKLKGFIASMHDWGSLDYHSMLHYISLAHPDLQLIVIGHSVGGQLVGLSPLSQKVEAFVTVGAQTPYIQNFAGGLMRLKLSLFWKVFIPVLTKITGYFPASSLGLFEDLPLGVAKQWADWAKSRNYVFDEFPDERKRFSSLQQASLMISFSDDDLAPKAAVEDLMQFYPNLKWNHLHLRPEDVLQQKVGHFGFFKNFMQSTMWREAVNWINATLEQKRSKAA